MRKSQTDALGTFKTDCLGVNVPFVLVGVCVPQTVWREPIHVNALQLETHCNVSLCLNRPIYSFCFFKKPVACTGKYMGRVAFVVRVTDIGRYSHSYFGWSFDVGPDGQ